MSDKVEKPDEISVAPRKGRTKKPRTSPIVARSLGELGSSLATWRKLRGLTQAQLASRVGVNTQTIHRLERGDGGVSFETVVQVLRALGIIDQLVRALDPYESDVGRLRADDQLPERVRTQRLKASDGGSD
jgi:transcriptional regulator with XRE-family HTH domain